VLEGILVEPEHHVRLMRGSELAVGTAFERRLLVAVDVAGYGGGDDQQHFAVQSGLMAALEQAAAAAGLRRDLWLTQAMGDGELAILPRDEPEPVVVEDYPRELAVALTRWNESTAPQFGIRLRVAIHFGAAMPADNGYAGQGVVAVSRLVDSRPVREALAAVPAASVAVILSRQVFDDVVRQNHVGMTESDFTRVRVQVKEYQDEAWLMVAGLGPGITAGIQDGATEERPAAAKELPEAAEERRAAAGRTLYQHFHGDVHARNAVFGISYNGRGDD
jgi:hypothetical protein